MKFQALHGLEAPASHPDPLNDWFRWSLQAQTRFQNFMQITGRSRRTKPFVMITKAVQGVHDSQPANRISFALARTFKAASYSSRILYRARSPLGNANDDPQQAARMVRLVAVPGSIHANSADEVLLRISLVFLQRWAGCKDSSRRSETATLKTSRGKTSLEHFVTTKDTKHMKMWQGPCDFNAILSCLSWLTQLTIEETPGDVMAYDYDGHQRTLDGPIFCSRHHCCFTVSHRSTLFDSACGVDRIRQGLR